MLRTSLGARDTGWLRLLLFFVFVFVFCVSFVYFALLFVIVIFFVFILFDFVDVFCCFIFLYSYNTLIVMSPFEVDCKRSQIITMMYCKKKCVLRSRSIVVVLIRVIVTGGFY